MRRLAPVLVLAVAGCSGLGPTVTPADVREGVHDAVEAPAARATSADLQRAVEAEVAGFDGVVGVYVRHLGTGATAAVRADERFPTASLVKVPLLAAVFDRIEAGELSLDQRLAFRDSLRYDEDEGELFAQLRDSSTVFLHSAVEQMLSASDNTASLWLQALVGGERVNAWLAERGFEHTRVNSRTPGRRLDWEAYGWGQTTPREMADLVLRIVEGRAVSPAADDEMHRLLTRTHWDDEALAALPPSVQAASKQGAVSRSRSEVVYVHAPSGPYVFCVITKDQGDTRYAPENAGYVLIRRLSRLFWTSFEPGSQWRPVPGVERYRL